MGKAGKAESAMAPVSARVPSSQQKCIQTIQELILRGTANSLRLRRAATPDPGLKPMVEELIQAQSNQLATLKALPLHLETGGTEDLSHD
jgi:hypothetical protein